MCNRVKEFCVVQLTVVASLVSGSSGLCSACAALSSPGSHSSSAEVVPWAAEMLDPVSFSIPYLMLCNMEERGKTPFYV